jgi:hypothetical protein
VSYPQFFSGFFVRDLFGLDDFELSIDLSLKWRHAKNSDPQTICQGGLGKKLENFVRILFGFAMRCIEGFSKPE